MNITVEKLIQAIAESTISRLVCVPYRDWDANANDWNEITISYVEPAKLIDALKEFLED